MRTSSRPSAVETVCARVSNEAGTWVRWADCKTQDLRATLGCLVDSGKDTRSCPSPPAATQPNSRHRRRGGDGIPAAVTRPPPRSPQRQPWMVGGSPPVSTAASPPRGWTCYERRAWEGQPPRHASTRGRSSWGERIDAVCAAPPSARAPAVFPPSRETDRKRHLCTDSKVVASPRFQDRWPRALPLRSTSHHSYNVARVRSLAWRARPARCAWEQGRTLPPPPSSCVCVK